MHTIYASRFRIVGAPRYARERIETPDGDFIDLDWSRANSSRVAVVLHGLEGSSDRPYMRGIVHALNAAGWDVAAVNFRGCSGEPNRLLTSYHSGATHDLKTILDHVFTLYSNVTMVGYSLGGNLMLKYLGEVGDQARVRSAIAFSVPCDLKASATQLAEKSNRVYMWKSLAALRTKIEAKASQFPEVVDASGFDSIRDFITFDEKYTAPLNGFENAEDYWKKCSCTQFLSSIRIPTLLVSAADDPFLADSCYPIKEAESSDYFSLEIPRLGGHVGFHQWGRYWSERRVVNYLEETQLS